VWGDGSDPLFVCGNGTPARESNAFVVYKNGTVDANGSNVHSDARLKKHVQPLGDVLPKVEALRGVTYEFKDKGRYPAGKQIGFIAQEVQAQFPELVHETTNGYLSLSYEKFTAVLLEAVKEQQALIEERDQEVAALRKELETTRSDHNDRLARLEALLADEPEGGSEH